MTIDTIFAPCTSRSGGTIGLIRVSGPDAISFVTSIAHLSSKKTLAEQETHTIHHGVILDNNDEMVDDVLFLLMKGPRTFTGEDIVEITCHNNQFIIEEIQDLLRHCGARMAMPGEFTQRAYLNDKLDLTKAEAIHDIITAPSQAALKKSLAQLHGSLSRAMQNLEVALIRVAALVEASFDFLEEEERDLALTAQISEELSHVYRTITTLMSQHSQAQAIREGVRVALVGSVNAGKSTLLNTLLGRDRAIVSSAAGTTRDTIEAGVTVNGQVWTYIDTAGLRITDDVIEAAGIERSYKEAALADVVVLAIDQSQALNNSIREVCLKILNNHAHKAIVVLTKADAPQEESVKLFVDSLDPFQKIITVSAHNQHGIDTLTTEISSRVTEQYASHNSPFLLNQRHYNLLQEAAIRLEKLLKDDRYLHAYELLATELNHIIAHLAEVTGKSASEAVMDTVFSTFCVGK